MSGNILTFGDISITNSLNILTRPYRYVPNTRVGTITIPNSYVGIGVTAPKSRLHILGDIRASNYLLLDGSPAFVSLWSQSGSSIYYNSGNVGIGTSSPSAKLEVNGGHFKMNPSYSIYSNFLRSAGASNTYINLNNTTSFIFGLHNTAMYYDFNVTGGSSLFRINGNGNVLIGTTTDSGYKLDVNGNTQVSGILSVSDSIGVNTNSPTYSNSIEIAGSGFSVGGLYLKGTIHWGRLYLGTDHRTYLTAGYQLYLQSGGATVFNGHGGSYIANAVPSTPRGLVVTGINASYKALVVKGNVSQSANLQEWIDGSNNILSLVDNNGNIAIGADIPVFQNGNISLTIGKGTNTPEIILQGPGNSTSTPNNNFIAGLAFKPNEATYGSPHYSGIWAVNSLDGITGEMDLRLAAGKANYESNIPHLSINNNGNIGIGTTSPTYKLDINGTLGAQLTNATQSDVVYYNSTTGELTYGVAPASNGFIGLYDSQGSTSYCGIAPFGSLTSDPVWKVTKIIVNLDGSTTVTVANNIAWDNRLTETYV